MDRQWLSDLYHGQGTHIRGIDQAAGVGVLRGFLSKLNASEVADDVLVGN